MSPSAAQKLAEAPPQSCRQSAYWDSVAGHIRASDCPNKDMVGYHSPYDLHVRATAVRLLDRFTPRIPQKEHIAELGSGAGLNLRYFSRFSPRRLFALDCSPELLNLARANLSDLTNVDYIRTSGYELPIPAGVTPDLLFTVTVLQHVTDPAMYASLTRSMAASNARYILLLEDTRSPARQVTPDYTLRTGEEYAHAFAEDTYTLKAQEFVSLTWAVRVFGVINRLYGLYRKDEGARLPRPLFAAVRLLSPLVRRLDALLPGRFGMSALLFERKADA